MEHFYRVGKTAELLGTKAYHIRELCRLGLIAGVRTNDGHHYLIPVSAIDKMRRDGVPPIPANTDVAPAPSTTTQTRALDRTGLLAEPSDDVVRAAEDLAIAERRVKTRGLDLQLERIEDEFRDRDAKAQQQEAAAYETERQRTAVEEQSRLLDSWCQVGMRKLPTDFPLGEQCSVIEKLREKLRTCDLVTQSDTLTAKIVDSIVAGFVRPFQRQTEAAEIAEAAIPWDLRYDPNLSLRATEAVEEAVARLGPDATDSKVRNAVERACQPLVLERDHRRRIERLVSSLSLPFGLTSQEAQAAREAALDAMSAVPPGSLEHKYEHARDEAVRPYVEAFNLRKAREDERRRTQADESMRTNLLTGPHVDLIFAIHSDVRDSEIDAAVSAVRNRFATIPEGASRTQLESVKGKIFELWRAKHRRIEQALASDLLRKALGSLPTSADLTFLRRKLSERTDGKEATRQFNEIMREVVDDLIGGAE